MNDIQENLAKAGLEDIFNKLPSSHQKEYIKWIEEAKKPETRRKRIQKMLEMVKRKSQ